MTKFPIDGERPPIFVGAGVAKLEDDVSAFAASQAAAVVIGSFTDPEWAGNDQGGTVNVEHWEPNEGAYYNTIGLKNPGRVAVSAYLPRTIKRLHAAGISAVVNVSTLARENPKTVLPGLAEWALEMGADGVEINGSCQNQDPRHPLLCLDAEAARETLGAVRQRVGNDPYLIFKVSAMPLSLVAQYSEAGKLAVDAIDTINTIGNSSSPINPQTGEPYIEVNNGLAGKSGPVVNPIARANLLFWRGIAPPNSSNSYDVWSIGGVDNGFEVGHRLALGALLVGGTQQFRRASDRVGAIAEWAAQLREVRA